MLDVVKGYYNMGLARWLTATMLTLRRHHRHSAGDEADRRLGYVLRKELVCPVDGFLVGHSGGGFCHAVLGAAALLEILCPGGARAHSMRMVLVHYTIENTPRPAACQSGICLSVASFAGAAADSGRMYHSDDPVKFAFNTIIVVLSMNSSEGASAHLISETENGLKTLFILDGVEFWLGDPAAYFIYRNRPIV